MRRHLYCYASSISCFILCCTAPLSTVTLSTFFQTNATTSLTHHRHTWCWVHTDTHTPSIWELLDAEYFVLWPEARHLSSFSATILIAKASLSQVMPFLFFTSHRGGVDLISISIWPHKYRLTNGLEDAQVRPGPLAPPHLSLLQPVLRFRQER